MKLPPGSSLSHDHQTWLARLRRGVSLRVSARGVSGVGMLGPPEGNGAGAGASPLAERARREIAEYLAGRRRAFQVRADLSACTPFIQAVLREAARIPYGETRTYGWIARKIGRPGAARAVGQALGRNPAPLIVPCHRVTAQAGLGGFARERRLTGLKAALIALERAHKKGERE